MEKTVEVPEKIKNRYTSVYLSEKNEDTNLKRYMHPCDYYSIIYIAKIWKQPKCPSIDEWIKKM